MKSRLSAAILGVTLVLFSHSFLAYGRHIVVDDGVLVTAAGGGDSKPAAEVKPDRYGDPLPPEALARLGTLRFRDAQGVSSLAFTPDGRKIVSGGWRGARIFDAATGQELARLGEDLPNGYGPAGLSADAKRIAVGGWGPEMGGAVYEVAGGRKLYSFGKPSQNSSGCFSPDGKLLAAYPGGDGSIQLHDAESGQLLRSLKGHELKSTSFFQVAGVVFSPHSKHLISAGGDGAIRIWDVVSGNELRHFTAGEDGVWSSAVSPDGAMLASAATKRVDTAKHSSFFPSNRIRLWNIAAGKLLHEVVLTSPEKVKDEPRGPNCLAFTPDSKCLLAGGMDRILRVLEAATGKELRRFDDHRMCLNALAVSPDGKTVAVAEGVGTIRLRDLASGRDLGPTGGHHGSIRTLVAAPDGRAVATASEDDKLFLWDPRTGRELKRLPAPGAWRNLIYEPKGHAIFWVGNDKTLRRWDAEKELVLRPASEIAVAGPLAISPDAKRLAFACRSKTVLLLDAPTGKELLTLDGPKKDVSGLVFSADGDALIGWTWDRHLHYWDAATGKHRRRACPGLPESHWSAFSPDGRYIAFFGQSPQIVVLDVTTGNEVCRFANRSGESDDAVHAVAFSPDGRTLAWGGATDRLIRLGELATGQERHRLPGHKGRIQSLAFAEHGKLLISGSDDTTALVWDMTRLLPIGDLAKAAIPKLPLTEGGLATLWEALSGSDAVKAYAALRALAASPERSLPYLAAKLRPVATPEKERVARLIAELGSDRFAERNAAAQELEKMGDVVLPALEQALVTASSLEMQRRLEVLARKLRTLTGEQLRTLRAIEALERMQSPKASELLQELAGGAPGSRLTKEARLSLNRRKD
ncbi:MAG: PD40 domain-containing protein [Planctomycetes bacterium]|nr:PD40 domain-containing protein [Planctomycetota bacterium]